MSSNASALMNKLITPCNSGRSSALQLDLGALRPSTEALADVGSFTGWGTERYARACAAEHVTCFDLSGSALKACVARGFTAVEWNCEEASPAADQSFTVVVAADIIEHLVNTDGFVSELHRVLRPGGLLILTTPNLAYWLNRVRLASGRVPWSYPGVSSTFRRSESVDLNHIRINVPGEWIPFFEARGFRSIDRSGYSIFRLRATNRLGKLRTAIDEFADDHAPDFAFGNIYMFERRS